MLFHGISINTFLLNRLDSAIILSGCDDGIFKVWDLRNFKPYLAMIIYSGSEIASYKWYNDPITSVEWSPHEKSVLSVSGDDGQLTIWDLSLEKDGSFKNDVEDIPPQLLFVHRVQFLFLLQ